MSVSPAGRENHVGFLSGCDRSPLLEQGCSCHNLFFPLQRCATLPNSHLSLVALSAHHVCSSPVRGHQVMSSTFPLSAHLPNVTQPVRQPIARHHSQASDPHRVCAKYYLRLHVVDRNAPYPTGLVCQGCAH